MAAKASTAVGSQTWVSAEKENVQELLQQEKEELIYPAQHEMEWLNEHMAEIFSRNQFNVTDVFKTPGKLRGKTPRTARKRNALETRIPLSDVFSSKPYNPSSPQRQQQSKTSQFTIAADPVERTVDITVKTIPKSHTDSGYHGSSQDEMEIDVVAPPLLPLSTIQSVPLKDSEEQQPTSRAAGHVLSEGRRTTEGSFHSAKEEQTTKLVVPETISEKVEGQVDAASQLGIELSEAAAVESEKPEEFQHDLDDIGSPSDESTPDRPLVRKSSLNFASLPAREPLKSNAESRMSRASHLENVRIQVSRTSAQTAKVAPNTLSDDEEMSDDGSHIEILGHDESDVGPRLPPQYRSTQQLHEKINMLGKATHPRPSKSIPSAAALVASHQRQSEAVAKAMQQGTADDDDEWIKPLKSPEHMTRQGLPGSRSPGPREGDITEEESDAGFDLRAPELIAHEERMRTPVRSPSPSRPMYGHNKSHSTVTLASPSKAEMAAPPSPAKTISVSNPSYPSTTPQGSPKRMFDGTLSASKSKLHSMMKTAKGLFTSSASVSAAAKIEALSPNAIRMAAERMPGLYPNLNAMLENKPLPASPPREGRKTRSSTEKEKEKESRAMQKMDDQLHKAREKERQKAAQFKESLARSSPGKAFPQPTRMSPRRMGEDQRMQDAAEMPPPSMQVQGSKASRPIRPVQNNLAKPKPVPVSIRVGTLSQRMPVTAQSLASNAQETLPAEPKRPGLSKKISNASLQSTASTAGFKSTSSHPTKPKALLAAERKREQDEREAQRKLEQKKEMERRRAAQQEEAKRQEQRQRAEAERKERERVTAEQAKRQAQQQAIERKRQENARKVEQQRMDPASSNAPARPPSRLGSAQPLNRSLIGHALPTNPAKPAKRPLEEDAGPARSQPNRFGTQQADSKRRKTEDENDAPRPTMSGAPIRQSNLGKKPSIFNHSLYAPVQGQPHLNQFPQPPNPRLAHTQTMAQYGNGAKIPFAEAPNPPHHTTKTPMSAYQQRTLQLVKSSPQYQNGEAINLPEIPTDSEDEDSENEGNAFPIPDWATPGHLTDQLIRQEGIDGDAVFGPIAPLKMEEIFAKGNKERLKRMRERTSSANWAMSGDGLTLEEVRADREMRERMRTEGGWRFGGN